ncbi:hypothetical protein [Enterocloster phage PMBT24]|uniref:NYN domain-containing protein n=1 Tax=Enterocloster phage PMBT24 TaxID=3025413 RepID=A0AAT9TR75_9CAUD|nr:hypothetical protein [Enterocloster phage PMBT24]
MLLPGFNNLPTSSKPLRIAIDGLNTLKLI